MDWIAYEEHHRYWAGLNGGKDPAAYLCRRYSRATLRELSERFGLSHPDSASDLIRRGAKQVEQPREAARYQKSIETKLGLNPESRV